VGGGLGWLIDHWLDSWPIASAIGLVLGLVAGFRNVWADARYLERSNAVIDAEKKKKEEEKAAKDSGAVAKKPAVEGKPAVADVPAPDKPVAKAGEKSSPAEESPRDDFTASVLAGMASPEERELEELDELELLDELEEGTEELAEEETFEAPAEEVIANAEEL
jgi:hypothetical protein